MQRIAATLSVFVALAFAPAQGDHAALPDGVSPVMATWLWGYHTVPASITTDGSPRWYAYPHTDASRINDPPWTDVAATHIETGATAPAVVWLHGCSGMPRGPIGYRIYLMSKGYALFEPDSFARPGRKPCTGNNLPLRREEIAFALRRIRELPWVDQARIVLAGVSEGGRAVGGWERAGFAAHIILAAACGDKSGRPHAPGSVPVLAIVGSQDGASCNVTRKVGGSRSIIIPGAPHGIMDRKEVKEALERFLRECCE